MGTYRIEGGYSLGGEVDIHGAKNAVLPILAAALLCPQSAIHNCPDLSDVQAACSILTDLGCKVQRQDNTITVDSTQVSGCDISRQLMHSMRSSIMFLGALIAKCGHTRVSFPGGCELGPRPIDLHLSGLQALGMELCQEGDLLECSVAGRLKGTEIRLNFPSVGATENIMLAACLAEGETVLYNAAREPEILDLAGFLNACGAKITCQEGTIRIIGVTTLHPAEYTVIPDRIEAATYLTAAAVTRGECTLHRINPAHLQALFPVLQNAGCQLQLYDDAVAIRAGHRLRSFGTVSTAPYPGFPTDAQAPVMVMAAVAQGSTLFRENIFESRYKHVPELCRMGAKIQLEGRTARVDGVDHLCGASVCATDLRGGAALVLAALAAKGESCISDIYHIQRGYENFHKILTHLGAKIRLTEE